MQQMTLQFRRVDWPFTAPFRIAGRTITETPTVQVAISNGAFTGRGEGVPIHYRGETIESLSDQLAELAHAMSSRLSRDELLMHMPPGGARNAVDCALWDLAAKQSRKRAWELAGVSAVHPLRTSYTLSVGTPTQMSAAARAVKNYPLLKVKLDGTCDVERVAAIRHARPDASIIVDANQSWSEANLDKFAAELSTLGVLLIEQPLPVGCDDILTDFVSPLPLCADESCQTTSSLATLRGKYAYVNIKLDKSGGLTEALRLAQAARDLGFKLMVGCMGGSSLSMAPAFIVGQLCDFADLDAPLLASRDIATGMRYSADVVQPPDVNLWG